jgi:hypothetical protein
MQITQNEVQLSTPLHERKHNNNPLTGIGQPIREIEPAPAGVTASYCPSALTLGSTSSLILGHIRAIPPSSAQSLKESSGVSIAIGLGLHEVQRGLLISLFRT